VFPPEPPVAIPLRLERRAAVKGRAAFGRREANPWRRTPFGHAPIPRRRRSGNPSPPASPLRSVTRATATWLVAPDWL